MRQKALAGPVRRSRESSGPGRLFAFSKRFQLGGLVDSPRKVDEGDDDAIGTGQASREMGVGVAAHNEDGDHQACKEKPLENAYAPSMSREGVGVSSHFLIMSFLRLRAGGHPATQRWRRRRSPWCDA